MLVERFWMRLEGVLQLLASRLLAEYPDFKFQIGASSNKAFPLRAHLTILRSNEGEELSITVDIKCLDNGLSIESDVVGEEGLIVADGPSLKLDEDMSGLVVQLKVDEWFESFEQLFVQKLKDIDAAIRNLE